MNILVRFNCFLSAQITLTVNNSNDIGFFINNLKLLKEKKIPKIQTLLLQKLFVQKSSRVFRVVTVIAILKWNKVFFAKFD